MKTIITVVIATASVCITLATIHPVKSRLKEMKTCLKESTHQGYRSFIVDYIK